MTMNIIVVNMDDLSLLFTLVENSKVRKGHVGVSREEALTILNGMMKGVADGEEPSMVEYREVIIDALVDQFKNSVIDDYEIACDIFRHGRVGLYSLSHEALLNEFDAMMLRLEDFTGELREAVEKLRGEVAQRRE